MSQVDLSGYSLDRLPRVVLDTKVLLLYLTGVADPDSIKKFKRTQEFSKDNFQRLTKILGRFRKIVTTPHVLTETSNFAGQAPPHLRRKIRRVMSRLVPAFSEEQVPSDAICGRDEFLRLGLTDVAIADLAASCEPEILVLTTDVGLYDLAWAHDTPAINFTHIMARSWG